MPQNLHVLRTFDSVHNPLRLPRETTSERPKVLRTCQFFTLLTRNVLRATTACTFSTSQLPKVPEPVSFLQFFAVLTSKCASRYNGVHFFDMSTSKSDIRAWCVLYILTSKRASRHNGVHFFDIATSKSDPNPSVFFALLTSKCASRHNGVHFFDMSTSKSGPSTVCFVHFDFQMCFAP